MVDLGLIRGSAAHANNNRSPSDEVQFFVLNFGLKIFRVLLTIAGWVVQLKRSENGFSEIQGGGNAYEETGRSNDGGGTVRCHAGIGSRT